MIKSKHRRNINQTASLVFFLSTICQNKAQKLKLYAQLVLYFSLAPNSIYAFNKLKMYLSRIIKTAPKKLSNNTFHGSIS